MVTDQENGLETRRHRRDLWRRPSPRADSITDRACPCRSKPAKLLLLNDDCLVSSKSRQSLTADRPFITESTRTLHLLCMLRDSMTQPPLSGSEEVNVQKALSESTHPKNSASPASTCLQCESEHHEPQLICVPEDALFDPDHTESA